MAEHLNVRRYLMQVCVFSSGHTLYTADLVKDGGVLHRGASAVMCSLVSDLCCTTVT